MAEYIEKEALIAFLEDNHDDKDWLVNQYNADWICSWIESQHAADVVSRVAFDQVVWERDTAMEQLKEHGIPFGGKADVVAVKRGRWLQPKHGECFCSECKTNGSPQWKRCPVCEAKMDGGDAG